MKFDPVTYIQEARKLGFTQEQSEFNAQQLERIIEQQNHTTEKFIADHDARLDKKELSTKGDVRETELRLQKEIEIVRKEIREVDLSLRKEIKELEVRLIKWLAGFTIGAIVTIGGMFAKGFHWF